MRRHIWQVFTYELKRNLRRRGFLFTTFGLPLIAFLIVFGIRFISDINARNAANNPPLVTEQTEAEDDEGRDTIDRAGYVDLTGHFSDPGELSDRLVRYEDETAARAALDAGEVDAYYVIPADYLETGDVTLILPRFSLNQIDSGLIRRLILNNLASDVDPELFSRLVDPVTTTQEVNLQRDASGQTESSFDTDFAVVYIFAITLLLSVFMTNGYLMQTVIEEKETRLIEILISTMRPTQLLAGKILALGLLGLIQIVVWISALLLLGKFVAGDPTSPLSALATISLEPGEVVVLLLYFLFGYLFFAAAYGMVGALSNSMQEGPQYAVIFTLPAAIPLYFIALFISAPDAPLPTILSLFPLTASLSMVMRVTLTTVPLWQLALSLGLLIAADAVMIWAAGRMFRVQTLLAGQVPKLRDIPRLLRG
jgi:ABC-2 type transport system permease protein